VLYLCFDKQHMSKDVHQNTEIGLEKIEKDLLDYTIKEILEKFGAGKHKPGSGSAAAFQVMLSSKLLLTVIEITNRPEHKKRYQNVLPRLLEYSKDLENRIFPRLCELFKSDAVEFDKYIILLKRRNVEKNLITKNELRIESLEQNKVAILIPLEICDLSIEVCDIANYVFDSGFKSARGDSHVAFSGAVSALAGSLAIIRLNLLQFKSDYFRYSEKILSRLVVLDEDYTNYNSLATSKISVLQKEFDKKIPFYNELNDLIDRLKLIKKPTDLQIENGIRDFQNLVWKYKEIIWTDPPKTYREILDPKIIFNKVLNYDYVDLEEIAVYDENGKTVEIAGLINQANKLVVISNRFPKPTTRFTAAHELAHALFHKQSVLHRDIPVDNSGKHIRKSIEEKVADKGATYFLMPAKEIRKEFESRFKTLNFAITDQTAFNLTRRGMGDLKKQVRTTRELAKKLSSVESYNSQYFESLAQNFNVSVEAMAIRLEELLLLEY
jgi:Zn-dependent peptidase ImmA (M78 family)/formiminotetrahydrofolate cyclodeaminase